MGDMLIIKLIDRDGKGVDLCLSDDEALESIGEILDNSPEVVIWTVKHHTLTDLGWTDRWEHYVPFEMLTSTFIRRVLSHIKDNVVVSKDFLQPFLEEHERWRRLIDRAVVSIWEQD